MDEETVLRVRLTPKGGRDALVRLEAGVLHARVAAPPVDGAANRSLIQLLARTLGVAKSRISIVSGETSREKTVKIESMSEQNVVEILERELKES